MNEFAAISDAWLKGDGRGNRDWQGQGSHVTRGALLALVARRSVISRRTVMSNAGQHVEECIMLPDFSNHRGHNLKNESVSDT